MKLPAVIENIEGIAGHVAALDEDVLCTHAADERRRLLHVLDRLYCDSRELLRFGDVGGDHEGPGKKKFDQGPLRFLPDQHGAALCHHNGIDDQLLHAVLFDFPGHRTDDVGTGEHPRLCRIDPDIAGNGVKLLLDKLDGNLVDTMHTQCILGRQGRHHAHAETAEGGNCLQIRLNTRTAAGIGSGDGKHSFHIHLIEPP